jgi:glycosyltransferase involved in cell wall biosynthesis
MRTETTLHGITQVDPLVSVIIPHYQHRAFIERCLRSVWSQTYKNVEVIVVDDCSPDGSGEFVRQVIFENANQYPHSTIFQQFTVNQGAHSAINYGISKATGSIITIINSDDMYHPDRLKHVVAEMKQKNASLAFTKIRYINEQDYDVTQTDDTASQFLSMQEKIGHFPTVGFACLASNVAISTGNLIFTKELYQVVGEFSNFRYCHDWDFLMRALIHTEPIYLSQDLYYYRFHGTNTFGSVRALAVQECDTILYKYLDRVKSARTRNQIAPSPFNWPQFFELFLDLWKYSDIYKRMAMQA